MYVVNGRLQSYLKIDIPIQSLLGCVDKNEDISQTASQQVGTYGWKWLKVSNSKGTLNGLLGQFSEIIDIDNGSIVVSHLYSTLLKKIGAK